MKKINPMIYMVLFFALGGLTSIGLGIWHNEGAGIVFGGLAIPVSIYLYLKFVTYKI